MTDVPLDLIEFGKDEDGTPHFVWSDEADQHEVSFRCGCNPDWADGAWHHHLRDGGS
jgi:hypothetical protein